MPNPDGSPTAGELIAAALAGGGGGSGSRDHTPQLRQDSTGRYFWWDPDNPGNVQYVDGLPGRGSSEPQPTTDWQWTGTDGPHGRVYVQQMSNGRQRYMYADVVYDSITEVSALISSQGGPVDDNTGRPINAPREPGATYSQPQRDPATGKYGRWKTTPDGKVEWETIEGGPGVAPDTSSPRSGGSPVSIGGGSSGGTSRSTFTPDYNSSGAADQTAAWAHSDAQQKAQNDWQAAQNELNRAQDAYQFAQRMGLDTAKFKLDLQQAQITAAKAYADLVSTPDLNALQAFLDAGGGNVSNALAGGGTMLTDNAIRPGAMALQGIRDLAAINPYAATTGGASQPIGGPIGSPPSTTAPLVNAVGGAVAPETPAGVTPTDLTKIPLGVTKQVFGPDPTDPTKQVQTGWRLSDGTVINNDGTVSPNTAGTTSPGQTGSDWDAIVQRWNNQPHQVGNSQITMAGYDPAHPPPNMRGMLRGTGFWGAPAQQLASIAFDTNPANIAALEANNPWMRAMYSGWLPLAMSMTNPNDVDLSQLPPEFRPYAAPPRASLEDQMLINAPKKTGRAPTAVEMGVGTAPANSWDPTLAAAGGKNERAPGASIPVAGAEAGGGVDTPITNVPGRQPFPTAGDMGVPLVKDGVAIAGPLPRFGSGGMMRGMGIVGERGKPELVIAPKGAMVIPMDRMQQMMRRVRRYGDGGTINPYDPQGPQDTFYRPPPKSPGGFPPTPNNGQVPADGVGIPAPVTPWKTGDTKGNFNPTPFPGEPWNPGLPGGPPPLFPAPPNGGQVPGGNNPGIPAPTPSPLPPPGPPTGPGPVDPWAPWTPAPPTPFPGEPWNPGLPGGPPPLFPAPPNGGQVPGGNNPGIPAPTPSPLPPPGPPTGPGPVDPWAPWTPAPSVPGSAAGGGPMYGYPGGASHDTTDPFNPPAPSAPPPPSEPWRQNLDGSAQHGPPLPAPSTTGPMDYQVGLAAGNQYNDPNNPGGVFNSYPVTAPTPRPAQGGGTGSSYPVPNIVPTSGPTGGHDPNLPFDNGGDPMDIVRNFRQNAKTLPGFNPYDVGFWNQPSALRQQGFKAFQTKYGVPVDVQEEEARRMQLQGRGSFRYGY